MIAPADPSSSGLKWWWGIVAATIVAAGIRFYGLDQRQLWLDENCTYYWARHFFDWPASGPQPWQEPAHLPYYLLLHAWCQLFGDSAWGLRSFSAVAGIITVALLGLIVHRLAGRRACMTTAILAAFHPLHIYYSQEARVYSFWILVTTIHLAVLLKAATSRQIGWWVAYVCVTWLAVLTHYYSLFWIPGTLAVALIASSPRQFLRRWLLANGILGLLLIPVGLWCILPYLKTGPADWQRLMWSSYPPLLAVPKSLWALLPSGAYPDAYLGPLSHAADWLGSWGLPIVQWGPAILFCAIAIVVLLRFTSSKNPRYDEGVQQGAQTLCLFKALVAISLLTLGFFAFSWFASLVMGRGYLVARYDLAAWPTFLIGVVLLLEVAAKSIGSNSLRRGSHFAAVSFLVVCSAVTTVGLIRQPVQNDLVERARRVAARVQGKDLLISLGLYRWFLEHEWDRLGFGAEVRSFPFEHDRQFCWQNAEDELRNPEQLFSDAARLVDEVVTALDAGHGVWMIAHGQPAGARWDADQFFFRELRGRGISIELQDEWVGLALLGRAGPRPIGESMQRP